MTGKRLRLNEKERSYLIRLIKGNIYKQEDMVSKDIQKLISKLRDEQKPSPTPMNNKPRTPLPKRLPQSASENFYRR